MRFLPQRTPSGFTKDTNVELTTLFQAFMMFKAFFSKYQAGKVNSTLVSFVKPLGDLVCLPLVH